MPRNHKTGPQSNGPRTGRGMGLNRGGVQPRYSGDGSCKRMNRRMRNGFEEGPNCNRRGNAVTRNELRARQNMHGSQGRKFIGQGRIGFVDFE